LSSSGQDNLEIYNNIIQTEINLIYYHFFTLSEINKLSYFDFKMYTKLLHNQHEAAQEEIAAAQEGTGGGTMDYDNFPEY
jgi:hypothetical protein